MNDQEFSNATGSLLSGIRDAIFNPEKRQKRLEKKDAKNSLKNSEANLNNAMAQSLVKPGEGMSMGAILGISFVGISLVGGLLYLALKSKQNG